MTARHPQDSAPRHPLAPPLAPPRRQHLGRLLGLALAGSAGGVVLQAPRTAQAAAAQSFPTHPVTIVVPFVPGGTTDIFARVLAEPMAKLLGQTVVVENRPGAGGNIGAGLAARAAPDGHTLLMGTVGTHAINESLYRTLPYRPVEDFVALSRVAMVPNILVTRPGAPFKSVQELIAYAKANPGKLSFASSGSGTSIHLSAELFRQMLGLDMAHVPYKGSAQALADLVGGQTDLMFDNMPSALQLVRGGKLPALAVTSAQRSSLLPDVPTVAESGVPGFETSSWFGLFARAGTPQPALDRLTSTLSTVLADADVRRRIEEQGGILHPDAPGEFLAFTRAEASKWAGIVKTSGARAD